jgi:hypothetical protein
VSGSGSGARFIPASAKPGMPVFSSGVLAKIKTLAAAITIAIRAINTYFLMRN